MCNNPMEISHYGKTYKVPCRWCMGCRTDRISELSTRTRFEIAYLTKKLGVGSSFVTVTYNDKALYDNLRQEHEIEHLQRIPYDVPFNYGSLYPNDFAKLVKKLRYYLKRKAPILEKEFKYLSCGEYGDQFERCHFHAIFCGLPVSLIGEFLRKAWSDNGFCQTSVATPTRINYCLEYIEKQVHGDKEYETFYAQGKIPPYVHISKGLGERYWSEHWEELCAHDGLLNDSGKFIPISKYFAKKYGFDLKEYSGRQQAKQEMRFELSKLPLSLKNEWEQATRLAQEKQLIVQARKKGLTPPTLQLFSIQHGYSRLKKSDENKIQALATDAITLQGGTK